MSPYLPSYLWPEWANLAQIKDKIPEDRKGDVGIKHLEYDSSKRWRWIARRWYPLLFVGGVVLLVSLGIGVLISSHSALLENFFYHRESARLDAELDRYEFRIKQLAVELHRYANAHGGKYPDSLGALIRTQYIPSSQIFLDPFAAFNSNSHVRNMTTEPCEFKYGDLIYAGGQATTSSPSSTIILYEPDPPFPALKGRPGGVWVLFIDGKTCWFDSLESARQSTGTLDDAPSLTAKLKF
ncbi:MAG: hypothetical protein M3O30_02320 [Planctomycetota bacterium]|nr:hypothetical protein [Planctomycetota bacterium]